MLRPITLLTVVVAGWFCFQVVERRPVFAQSPSPIHPEQSFHIEGTIVSPWDLVPKGTVHFHNEQLDKTVTLDDKGFYQADLPIGFYALSVNAKVLGASLTPYTRAFRVIAPTTIVVDATLQMEQTSCDGIFPGDTPEEQLESMKDMCGGQDVIPIPAKDGTPFELLIRYPERQLERGGLRYKGGAKMPVFVAYNLFSLQANEVFSNPKHPSYLSAIGDVTVTDGSGKVQHLKNAHFTFQDGVAAQFREELPRPQDLP